MRLSVRHQSVASLHQSIQRLMPMTAPGSLSAEQSTDIIAFLLRESGYPAGKTPLPSTLEELRRIRLEGAP